MELGSLIRSKNVNTVFSCNVNIVIIHTFLCVAIILPNTYLRSKHELGTQWLFDYQ